MYQNCGCVGEVVGEDWCDPLFMDVLVAPKAADRCGFSMEFHHMLCGSYIINSFIYGEMEIIQDHHFSSFIQ